VRGAAESLFLVVALTCEAFAQAVATQSMVDVAALNVATEKAERGRHMWADAIGVKVEVATVTEVTIRVAELGIDQGGVQVSARVPALKYEQWCVLR
jgi:hypothetical protein